MHSDANVVVDFVADWVAFLRRILKNAGFTPAADDQTASFQFFNWQKRLVEPRRRKVHEAPDLECPPEHSKAYESLKKKIARGDDLRPHLSRGLANIDFDDMLVNDWGIHHLHLGTTLEGDGFVSRTGHVVFAHFSPDDARVITIQLHGKGHPNVWTSQDMLRTLHRTWPEVTQRWVMAGLAPSKEVVSDDDLRKARAAGLQALLSVDNVVLAPIGGGYSTARVAMDVVTSSDRHMDRAQRWERELVASWPRVRTQIESKGRYLPRPTRLRLDFEGDGTAFVSTLDIDGKEVRFKIGANAGDRA